MDELKETVLLVEDDASVRKYIARLLVRRGYAVLEAKDGIEAVKLYREKHKLISAIVSDLIMPNMDGMELAEFNFKNCFFPFIAFTVLDDAKNAVELMKFGVRDYVLKPVVGDRIISVIKNAIKRYALAVYLEEDENPYSGNVGSLVIPSRLKEIKRAMNWVASKLKSASASEPEIDGTVMMVNEIVMNAHEHGNLKINEKEKGELIGKGIYEEVFFSREKECNARISIDLSVLKNEAAFRIADDGVGFRYFDYLNLSEQEIIGKIENFNGRGVYIASKFFDSFEYTRGGSIALMTKKFGNLQNADKV